MVLPSVGETEKDAPPQLMDPFASSFSGVLTPAPPSNEIDKRHPASPILSAVKRFSTRFNSLATSEAESQCTQMASLNQLHSKLLGVVMRVSAYPIALVIINILHTGGSGNAMVADDSTRYLAYDPWRSQDRHGLAVVLHLYLSLRK